VPAPALYANSATTATQPTAEANTVSAQPASAAKNPSAAPQESLASFIAKFRELSAQARPPRPAAATIESTDVRLREALAIELVSPTPEHMRNVAAEYRRLRIFDRAHTFLSKAQAADPQDAVTYDALARLWRDSGFPQLGLSDAHRAVYVAPASPAAHNTLGTILQALGHRAMARQEYERALALNPGAAYALNNLCYTALLDGEVGKAVTFCQRALDAEPTLTAARNNLALAYVSQGDHAAAAREFAAAGDRATALYNTGIVHMAQREYGSAVQAFQAAHALKPTLKTALARAKQAAEAARNTEE
jgi:tetratricopeptide (TPR) repeat protein